ncbi:hypothetical protein ACJRO7_005054 [Eucalyptus globulus]|uniref:Carboxypeptidase n=1 Tax=Eucalyptus globulus TaxID=34317 RepID=A0ABD3J424_EUCGL
MAPRILSLFMLFYCSISYAELITSLPGQPFNVSFKQYSGYVVTDGRHGQALFYYFVEAESPIASFLPLTLWLNGGPGCSSLGFGTLMEHGPFKPSDNGSLIRNDYYSWNLESNMLYVESPIGVGFSYSNTSSDYMNWNVTRNIFLTGESYAGHYIPQFAKLLIDYNKRPDINLSRNPLLDLDISIQAGDYLWAHGAISDEMLYLERTVCNNSKYMREYLYDQYSDECNCVLNISVNTEVGKDVQFDNLLLRKCPLSSSSNSEQFDIAIARRGLGVTGDPCLQGRIFAYLNKPKVQRAIHANTTHLPFNWDFCQGPLLYQEDNLDMNLIPLVGIKIQKSLLTQTRMIANNLARDLKLVTFSKYGPWYDKKQVGGWSQSFGTATESKNVTYLTFATVRRAAYKVAFTSPSQALTLFRSFLSKSPLPRPRD